MNRIESIQSLRLLDGVVQYSNGGIWKPLVDSVETRTEGGYLELSDVNKHIRINSATDQTVTITNLPYPDGSVITFEQAGAGTITLVESGVTINGVKVTSEQYKSLQILKVGRTEWTTIISPSSSSSATNTTPQTVTYSATPTMNFETSENGIITLTGDVTTFTLTNVPNGSGGNIVVIQDETGGYGITDFVHTGLTVLYLGGGAAIAANIDSTASAHNIIRYDRLGDYLYISFAPFSASA